MGFKPFFDDDLGQEIIELTRGVLVEYRGQQAQMHCEAPTIETLTQFQHRVQGVAKILRGQMSSFTDPPLERQTLITVDGQEWIIGDFGHPGEGVDVVIALTKSTRT